jgi:hypothetical protein
MSDYVEMLISQAGGDGDDEPAKAPSMPKGLTRGYSNAFLTMIGEAAAKALTIKDLENLDDTEMVEAQVNARGRANNPKWDHPIVGYQTFSEDQKAYLREQAWIDLGHEPPAAAA